MDAAGREGERGVQQGFGQDPGRACLAGPVPQHSHHRLEFFGVERAAAVDVEHEESSLRTGVGRERLCERRSRLTLKSCLKGPPQGIRIDNSPRGGHYAP